MLKYQNYVLALIIYDITKTIKRLMTTKIGIYIFDEFVLPNITSKIFF